MKFEREVLAEKLNRLKRALSDSSQVQSFTHVWFTGNTVRAYNGSLGVVVDLETDLSFGLPGKPLLGIVSSSGASEVSLTEKNASVNVQKGRSRHSMASLDDSEAAWPFKE